MNQIIVKENIEYLIYTVRGAQVMLDSDLTRLYQCSNGTKSINLADKRHIKRLSERFMFRLTKEEYNNLQFQFETTNNISKTLPFVFTKQALFYRILYLKMYLSTFGTFFKYFIS